MVKDETKLSYLLAYSTKYKNTIIICYQISDGRVARVYNFLKADCRITTVIKLNMKIISTRLVRFLNVIVIFQ